MRLRETIGQAIFSLAVNKLQNFLPQINIFNTFFRCGLPSVASVVPINNGEALSGIKVFVSVAVISNVSPV